MLKYYSYFSVGGYKDMYLGNSGMTESDTYYLPLLDIWKEQVANGNNKNATRLTEAEKVKLIPILTADESYGLPDEAAPLFSHGAYKLLHKVASTSEGLFAIRDIPCAMKDDNGRSIPFLLVVVADTDSDRKQLECIAAYAASHLASFCSATSHFFGYDPKFNGVVFHLGRMNELMEKAAAESTGEVETVGGLLNLRDTAPGETGLLLMPDGISRERAVKEQKISLRKGRIIPVSSIIPIDDADAAKRIRTITATATRNRRIAQIAAGAGISAVIIALIIWYMTRN